MMIKPMKSLKSHYPMIQVLIIAFVCHRLFTGFGKDLKTLTNENKQLGLGVNVLLPCLLRLEHLLFFSNLKEFCFCNYQK